MGEIATGSALVAKMMRNLDWSASPRNIPADLIAKATGVVDDAVGQYRASMDLPKGMRKSAWIQQFLRIFQLLASRRLQEQHDDVKSFYTAIWNDAELTMVLSKRAFRIASGVFEYHDQALFRSLVDWSRQFELQWRERDERLRSAVMSDSAEMSGEPLGLCKPRDPRAKDTFTARRIEQFRRRIETPEKPVGIRDMIDFLGYKDPSMFQRVCREVNSSHAARAAVERMLESSAEKFWSVVHARRKSREAPK